MRRSTLPGAVGAVVALALLTACGGGGGSSGPSVPLPGPPGNPGGGPSSGPSPTPAVSGAPAPTPTPVGATPTPVPTATPIGSTPTPSTTPTPNGSLTVSNGHGQINGTDNLFTGGIGEEPGDGDYSTGGQGPVNSTFGPGNVPCLSAMYDGPIPPGYHVHAFLGIYYNGSEIAVPDGLGMADPKADATFQGIPNWTQYTYNPVNPARSGCFYEMHTHDASGVIHIESSNPNAVPLNGSMYTLGDFLALWGIPISPSLFGPFSGGVSVWTSGQVARGGPGTNGEIPSNSYTQYNGSMTQIPLYSHEVIWVLIGSGNPTGASLPNVNFWDEY